ncbi:MAG TPA: hypothetical protein VF518_05980, partial [Polyangia bacterium]
YTGKASGFGETSIKKLRDRRPLGASDFSRALGHVAELAKQGQRFQRVLLVTDGVPTAGELGGDKLRPAAKSLGASGVGRLDVLAVGGIRDQAVLSGLVTAGLAADGLVLDAGLPASEQTRRLLQPTRSGLTIEVPGAAWVWPNLLNGIQPGSQVLLYADLPAGKPFRVLVGGKEIQTGPAPMVAVERPLLERAWVKARINRVLAQRDTLGAGDRDLGEALRKQAIDLSTRFRVLCPLTALLVLETEADYQRFGIERRALADILTVGPDGIALLARRDFALAPMAEIPVPAREPDTVEDANVSAAAPMKRSESMEGEVGKGGKPSKMAEAAPAPSNAAESPAPSKPMAMAPAPQEMAMPKPVAIRQEREMDGEAMKEKTSLQSSRHADRDEVARPAPRSVARRPARRAADQMEDEDESPRAQIAPYEGEFKAVMDLLAHKDIQKGLAKARAWRERDAGDVLALIALGEAGEASHDTTLASRAYGSIIDLFPGRADLRRYAGQRLERIRDGRALALAVDTFSKAAEQRPDHPASHRLLAMALLKLGRPEEAFQALSVGLDQKYPSGRFEGAERILAEDMAMAAAVWMHAQPGKRTTIVDRLLKKTGLAPDSQASLRFVLVWETDANDVDFHIFDGKRNHAFYGQRELAS